MARDDGRQRARREQAQAAILTAALELFGERGFAESSTDEVARRAKLSKGIVFYHFPTKAALLQALVERTMSEILDYWESRPWRGAPRTQLARIVDDAVAQVRSRPHFYRLYFSLALQPGGSAAVEQALARLKPRLDAYLGRTARLMAEAGSADPELDARLFQCALNGLAQAMVAGGGLGERSGLVPVERLKKRLIETLVPAAPKPSGR